MTRPAYHNRDEAAAALMGEPSATLLEATENLLTNVVLPQFLRKQRNIVLPTYPVLS
jgi:hypothetical protein